MCGLKPNGAGIDMPWAGRVKGVVVAPKGALQAVVAIGLLWKIGGALQAVELAGTVVAC